MDRYGRRRFLRGVLNGAAVVVALPLFDCLLDTNGEALASGLPMPARFGNFTWGLGMTEKMFRPQTIGGNYDLPPELTPLQPIRDQVNLYTGFDVFTDGAPAMCHFSGWVTLKSGIAPTGPDNLPGETIDVTVARKIGRTTRFRSLSATATGNIRDSFSYENQNAIIAPEFSPLGLYKRLYGPGYQDPNAASFTPSPDVMVRKSILSGVIEESKSLAGELGANDKARLDQYFTGLRELERQLERQLTKSEPIAACRAIPAPDDDFRSGTEADIVGERNKLMADLLAMAVACDQTRVVNMAYAGAPAATARTGYDKQHHTCTHEELVDPRLGYQPNNSWFIRRAMESWSYFVQAFANIKEGRGTLLDNMLIYASTDHSNARIHSLSGVPMFTAGRAAGRMKTGLHVIGKGAPGTQVGLTAMRAMTVEIPSWGTKSNRVDQDIGEVLA